MPYVDIVYEKEENGIAWITVNRPHVYNAMRARTNQELVHALRDAGSDNDVRVVVLSVGNPQCVVLTDRLDEARFKELGPAIGEHEAFPEGTNVEFVTVEQPDLVRILIWERGVGPTTAAGTGACASAVAAAKYGGANRVLDVVSPGGVQHVEWDEDGIYLTGSAELIAHCKWFV